MPTSFCTIPDTPAEVDTPGPGSDVHPEAEPGADEWTDDGDSWWAPHPVPPSYRDAP